MLFPAYAGVIPAYNRKNDALNPFPRIRRGDPTGIGTFIWILSFSPHTQG